MNNMKTKNRAECKRYRNVSDKEGEAGGKKLKLEDIESSTCKVQSLFDDMEVILHTFFTSTILLLLILLLLSNYHPKIVRKIKYLITLK